MPTIPHGGPGERAGGGYDHDPAALTAGGIRAALAGLADDTPVVVLAPGEPGGEDYTGLVATAAGPGWAGSGADAFAIQCDYPPGRYFRDADDVP